MKCPKCDHPTDDSSRFCGNCGYKFHSEDSRGLKPKELFSIDQSKTDDSNDAVDEFLDILEAPTQAPNTTADNFFDDFSNPLTKDTEAAWEDDRKVFGTEDDPTLKTDTEEPEELPSKTLDKKTLKKIRKKQNKKSSKVSALFDGTSLSILLALISTPPIWFALKANQELYLRAFVLFPLGLLLLWPVLRKRGLRLNLIYKVCNFWFCGAFVYLLVLNHKAGLSIELLELNFNGFYIQVDLWMILHAYFVLFCHSLLFYFWRSKSHWFVKTCSIPILLYSLCELFINLQRTSGVDDLGGIGNPVSHMLKEFIGDLSLYLAPHYILTHIVIPITILILIVSAVVRLFQKKWSSSMSNLLYSGQGVMFLIIYLLPYRNQELSAKIFSLGPILKSTIEAVLPSLPVLM